MTEEQFAMRILIGVFLVLLAFACRQQEETIRPTLSPVTESVYASVRVIPDDTYAAYAARTGIIEAIPVEEGDEVMPGQVLLQVRAPRQNTRIEQARLAVAQARENYQGSNTLLEPIANRIERLQTTLTADSLDYMRRKRLWAQRIGSQAQLEAAQLKYQLTQKELAAARQEYRQKQSSLKNTYQQARKDLERELITADDYTVHARIDGMVYEILKEAGEQIGPQEPFARLGRKDSFHLEMAIDEVDIVRLSLDDLVLIRLDAYPDTVYEARITRIHPVKDESTQTFRVDSRFRQPPPVLYYGMSGEASIVIAEKEQTLTIPSTYLLPGDKVLTDTGEVQVQTGIKTLEYVEILSGIDTQTILLKPDGS